MQEGKLPNTSGRCLNTCEMLFINDSNPKELPAISNL